MRILPRAVSCPWCSGVVLGFMVESNYRRALVLSGGDHLTFLQDPISAVLLLVVDFMRVVIGSRSYAPVMRDATHE